MSSSRQNQYSRDGDKSHQQDAGKKKDKEIIHHLGFFSRKTVETFVNHMITEDPGFQILSAGEVSGDQLIALRKKSGIIVHKIRSDGQKPDWTSERTTRDDDDDDEDSDDDDELANQDRIPSTTNAFSRLQHDDDDDVSDISATSRADADAIDDNGSVFTIPTDLTPPAVKDLELEDEANAQLEEDIKEYSKKPLKVSKSSQTMPDDEQISAFREKLNKAMQRKLVVDKAYYMQKYNNHQKLIDTKRVNALKSGERILIEYQRLSALGIALIDAACTNSLRDKLHADKDYKAARLKPCIMAGYQALIRTLKKNAGDPTTWRNEESKKLLDFEMKPNESAASYALRFDDQLTGCLDAKVHLERKSALSAAITGLSSEYDGFRHDLKTVYKGYTKSWTVPDLMYRIAKYEEDIIKPMRQREKERKKKEMERERTHANNAVKKTKDRNARDNGNSNARSPPPCFNIARYGECRNSGCKFNHADPAASKNAWEGYVSRHDCATNSRCTDTKCSVKDDPAIKPLETTTANHLIDTAGGGGLSGCSQGFTTMKAIISPFRPEYENADDAFDLPENSCAMRARMHPPNDGKMCNAERDLFNTPSNHPDVLLLDGGCGKTLCKTRRAVDNFTASHSSLVLQTPTGDNTVEMIGTGNLPGPLHNVTGTVGKPGDLTANLLSEQDLHDAGWVMERTTSDNSHRRITNDTTGEQLVFVRNFENMFICSISALRRVPAATAVPANASVKAEPDTTKTMYELGFSRDTVKRALFVGVLHERYSYFGYGALYAIVAANRLPDCTLTVADVRNYFKYLHPRLCHGCLLGKMKMYPKPARNEPPPLHVGELFGLDEFFLTFKGPTELTIQVILGKDKHSNNRNVAFPKDSSAHATVAFVLHSDKLYQEYGHKIKNIVMDPSPAHLAAKPKLEALGYSVSFCAVGRHVTWIECDIGILKRALLAQLLGLPYHLPWSYYRAAIQYTVDSMSMLFASNPLRLPMEIFTKKSLNLAHYLSAKFGELVVSPVELGGDKALANVTRGEYGIVVDRDYSSPGSWFIRCLRTGRTRSRRDFYPCDTLEDDVRQQIERPDEGITDENALTCRWNPTDRDELIPYPPPITATIPLQEESAQPDFVNPADAPSILEDLPESDPLSEGVRPPTPSTTVQSADEQDEESVDPEYTLQEAHIPENIPFYDDTGLGLSEKAAQEALEEDNYLTDIEHPPAEAQDAIPEPTQPQVDDDPAHVPDPKQHLEPEPPSSDPKTKSTPPTTMNRRVWRAITGQSKRGRSAMLKQMQHPPTTRMRLRSRLIAANKLSVSAAQKEYGEEATNTAVWDEISQLLDKDAWTYLLPQTVEERVKAGERVLPTTVFVKPKYYNGLFDKYKCRLATCGNFAAHNPDLATESPTAAITTLLLALEMSARLKMHKITGDVGGAFLHAVSDQHHMMRFSKSVTKILVSKLPHLREYICNDGCIVVELNKTLYGLREASRAFHDVITEHLLQQGLKQSRMDKCLFYRTDENGQRMLVVLYVDDLLIMSTKPEDCHALTDAMKDRFKEVTVREGSTISFLGMEITTDDQFNVRVSQRTFISKVCEDTGITGTAATPSTDNLMKDHRDDPPADTASFYSTTMKLMYAAVRTRPDILYTVSVLSGRVQHPTTSDEACLLHLLRYLNGTRDEGLVFRSDSTWAPYMSVDASFNHHFDAKGHSGFVIFPGEGSAGILVKSLKQKTVANSSCEAELIALHEAVLYLLLIMSIYAELDFVSTKPIPIQQDNKAAILLSQDDPVNFRGRSKFINRMYFSVYEHVKSGAVELVHVGTQDTTSDFLTKSIIGDRFRRFKVVLMGSSPAA